MQTSKVIFLTCLCLLVIHETDAFPSLLSQNQNNLYAPPERRSLWLRPWRWLFSRKDEEDEDEEDAIPRTPTASLILSQLQSLPQIQHLMQSGMQAMASTQHVTHASPPLHHHQLPQPHALSALDALGPGTFMNYGEDLIYVPFSSLKQFQGTAPEWMHLWGNGMHLNEQTG